MKTNRPPTGLISRSPRHFLLGGLLFLLNSSLVQAAPSIEMPEEWLTPLESGTGFALADTETGQVRIMTFNNSNTLFENGPTETYLPDVTGLASGYFESSPEHIILSSATHNQFRLIPANGSASPSSRSTDAAGPQTSIPLNPAGTTPHILSHALFADGGQAMELQENPLGNLSPIVTDQDLYAQGASSLQPFRLPGSGARRGMMLSHHVNPPRLREIRQSGGSLIISTKNVVSAGSRLATEILGSDGRFCTIAYVPGSTSTQIFTHGVSGFPQSFATPPALPFPVGSIISAGFGSIPGAPDGALITSQDGAKAIYVRVVTGNSYSIEENFTASSGEAFAGLVPVNGRGFLTLLGTPADRSSSDWTLYRDSGSGFNPVASGSLSPWININNRFATLFWFDDQALVDPAAQILRVETVPDWTTGTGFTPQAISTELRDLNPNDGDGDQGLNNPSASSPVAPAGATFVMSNQYQANASVSALNDSITLSSLPLAVTPDSGTYSTSIVVNALADDSTVEIRYREDTPTASWQTYTGPLTIGYPSVFLFHARDLASGANGPIISRTYDFSSDPNDIVSDNDGVPDYVERQYGLDPAAGADSDGDFQSDLEEILGNGGISTDPNDSGDYLAEADRNPPYLGEGFLLYAQAFNNTTGSATPYDDGGTPVTDPSDQNLTATQRADDTPGEKIRAYNMISELLAIGEVAEVASGPLTGQNAARLDIANPLPEREWVILTTPTYFNLGTGGTNRGGRETIRVRQRPSFDPPTVPAVASGLDRASDASAWLAAARIAYGSFQLPATLTRIEPIDNAIAVLAEQALWNALQVLPVATKIELGVPAERRAFTLFAARDYDSGKTAFTEDMLATLVAEGCDFPAILELIDNDTRIASNIGNLANAIYARHRDISESTPNMALPLDALRSVLRNGNITDPGSEVALTFNPNGTVATSTTRPNPYATIAASLISNAQDEMDDILGSLPALKRPVETWTITIESPTTQLQNYDYRRSSGGNLAWFVNGFGDQFLIEQGLGLNLGAMFTVTGYTDVPAVDTFDTMEILSLEIAFTPIATDTDSNGNLLDDDWEKFFFGDLGVVGPYDPHPVTGHSYLQYHLEGADPRDGDLSGPVVPPAPSNVVIVPDALDNAYNIQFNFPDTYLSAVNFELHSATNLQGFSGPIQVGDLESLGGNLHQLKVSTADSTLDKNFFRIEMSLAE
jgi:hypothetical protein